VVVSCLHGSEADREVYLGPAGLLSVDIRGMLFIDTATTGPSWARTLAAEVESRGAEFVDAPILGAGPPSARAGRILFPTGGSPRAVARATPILELLGSTVEHVGDVGMGQVVKLVNNMQVAIQAASLAQAVRMALRAGVDPDALGRIVPGSSSRSRSSDMWLDRMLSHQHGTGGSLATLRKDIDLAVELAANLREPTSVGVAAAGLFGLACEQGLGDMGVSALIEAKP
jgi:3-hydroxyisobutyrate dehydrogenase-like beta-hydroxyacid dehydrogenase